jgi:uncharacterized membrane protein
VLGTFGSALAAPLLGIPRRRAFVALLIGTTVWCTILALLTDVLVEQLGPT